MARIAVPKKKAVSELDQMLAEDAARFFHDPTGFTRYAYPWEEPDGPLGAYPGPDDWQVEVMDYIGQQTRTAKTAIRVAISSGHGCGKEIACTEPVYTPSGPVAMGELKVGDWVLGGDGRPCQVLGVWHQGIRPLYRVTFSDGASVLAGDPHLWVATSIADRKYKRPARVVTTEEMRTHLYRKYQIPLCGAAEFNISNTYINPYIMGYLLGNGSLCTPSAVKISCHDPEAYAHITSRLPEGYVLSGRTETYQFIARLGKFNGDDGGNKVWRYLDELGLTYKKAHEKFIPEVYLYGTVGERIELLRGLMDSDGCCVNANESGRPNHYRVTFNTSSSLLRDGFIQLIQSLGGVSSYNTDVRRCLKSVSGSGRTNVGKTNFDNYQLSVNLPRRINPFYITRKADVYEEYLQANKRNPVRVVRSIEYECDDYAACIMVDSPDHTYLTKHYIVTHNSALASYLVNWFMTTRPDCAVVATANTKAQLQTKLWRELALWHKRSLFEPWFQWMATSLRAIEAPETWVANAIPWSVNNPEAFAGLHGQYVMVIFDEACHDDQTDVLTDQGWKRFADLDGTELLFTMDPDTGHCFYERPTRLYKAPYKGELWEYARRGANFCVTPNHKMLEQRYSPKYNGKPNYTRWGLTPINELTGTNFYVPKGVASREELSIDTFTIPAYKGKRKQWAKLVVPMDDWMVFLGWYFSEGHLTYSRGNIDTVCITQKVSAPLAKLRKLVDAWGCNTKLYEYDPNTVLSIRHAGLAAYLHALGRGCLVKRLPAEIRKASQGQQELFLRAFCEGDGYYKSPERMILYTSNAGLADDLQEVALLAGFNSTVRTRRLAGKVAKFTTHSATSTVDWYVVSVADRVQPRANIRRKHIQKVAYEGVVYCAEVPSHHTLLTRRQGVSVWSGNSAIEDIIWETMEGAMTTAGFTPIWVVQGNPTRSSGGFYRCFHDPKSPWKTFQVDSRTARMTNKAQLQEWIERWGADSNFARVRIYGEFPTVGDLQFIPSPDVDRAMANKAVPLDSDYLVLGVDIARKGLDTSVIIPRSSNRVLKPRVFRITDTMMLAATIAEVIDELHPDTTFVDGNGVGAGVVDRLRQLGYDVIDVLGQSKPLDERYYNKRAECYGGVKNWLRGDVQLPKDEELREELVGLEYDLRKDRILLEDKDDIRERIGRSPDKADALALTFAEPINAVRMRRTDTAMRRVASHRAGRDWRAV